MNQDTELIQHAIGKPIFVLEQFQYWFCDTSLHAINNMVIQSTPSLTIIFCQDIFSLKSLDKIRPDILLLHLKWSNDALVVSPFTQFLSIILISEHVFFGLWSVSACHLTDSMFYAIHRELS